jgi:hypothetical protein
MRSRLAWTVASVLTISVVSADSAAAQQSLNFSLGYFTVRGEDARVEGDALVANRDLYLFEFSDFNSPSFGAEWVAPLGDFVEFGAGIGLTSRGVDTIYDEFVRPDGSEIEQELKLRIIPITGTIRVNLTGRHSTFQPYVGGGIGMYNWRYSETGDFIDFTLPGRPVFRESYVNSGTSFGPVAVFGVRFLVGGSGTFGGEVRYQKAEGDLDEVDFLGPKIDLGGFHYNVTFGVRF